MTRTFSAIRNIMLADPMQKAEALNRATSGNVPRAGRYMDGGATNE